jgi:hypothetical protein
MRSVYGEGIRNTGLRHFYLHHWPYGAPEQLSFCLDPLTAIDDAIAPICAVVVQCIRLRLNPEPLAVSVTGR